MTPDMSSMDWRGRIAVLEAEVDALRADGTIASLAVAIARAEKAEAALRDCWAVMDASRDRRERELARKMRAALRDTAPAEQAREEE